MKTHRLRTFSAIALALATTLATAGEWRGYLGTSHSGQSDDTAVPLQWSETENIAWSVDLPGPGNSSPIVVNGMIVLTCYTGYGLSREEPGNINDLARHVLAFDARTGDKKWQLDVPAKQPEDEFKGYIQEHGYASNTAVSDGEHIYVFLGKTGVLALDMNGKEQWRTEVGMESNNRKWGSASSPLLYNNLLIVNGSDESEALLALDKTTGKQIWRNEATRMNRVYAAPSIIEVADRTDLVLRVAGEIWGMNPETGKLRWLAETGLPGTHTSRSQWDGTHLYTFGGWPDRASIAVKLGDRGDITDQIAWKNTKDIPASETPILKDNRLYWVDGKGFANCLDTANGKSVYKERIGVSGSKLYASPLLLGDKIVAVTRNKGAFVYGTGDEFEVIHNNVIGGDDTDFSATPAIADGAIYLRSRKALYCVRKP